ncbi:IS5 family transposase [Streptomyces sp. NPDC001549]|uniref:IS5 family transposase n=1 Tax=Streptomyces sp. NPDC001549 TaxID=3364586 RepID=UPI0036ADF31C
MGRGERGDLSDAEWERLRPFLPVSNGRCGRWRDHRRAIDGTLHRVRTGVHWRDLPERFGPWKTVYERHRSWSADRTWERLLQQVQAAADAAGDIDWDIPVDSTIVRVHPHAAGARTDPPSALAGSKGDETLELHPRNGRFTSPFRHSHPVQQRTSLESHMIGRTAP